MSLLMPLLLLTAAGGTPAGVTPTTSDAPPVAETELASMRGGFSLGNGLDVALAVQTDTAVNGSLLLRTVFRAEDGKPTLTTLAPSTSAVEVRTTSQGQRVQAQGNAIDVTHLVGNAIGSIVANSGSDRSIDTTTNVSIDIRGTTPMNIGSTMFRVEALGIDAVRGLSR